MPYLLLALCLILSLTGCPALIVGGVATGASIAHDRRTTGTIVDDNTIELKIYDALAKDGEMTKKPYHISVTSYNFAVLLSGEVANPALRQRAEDIARRVEKVKYVHNDLFVGAPSSLTERSNDALITSKVKASLFQIDGVSDFDPSRVKVVTERGSVYLFGLLRPKEVEAVTSTVRRVSGVQRVVKLFDLLDETSSPTAAMPAKKASPAALTSQGFNG